MKTKASTVLFLALITAWGFVSPAAARMQGALPGTPVAIEGTIEGLLSACREAYCEPGKEDITAAVENQYVLVAENGKIYSLPNVKPTLLARYLARRVRVTGNAIGGDRAILAHTAEVLTEGGQWFVFWSSGISHGVRQR